jgi:uncharacterized protein (DUF58 family)
MRLYAILLLTMMVGAGIASFLAIGWLTVLFVCLMFLVFIVGVTYQDKFTW